MREDTLRLVHVTILASICTNMWGEHTTRGGVHTKYHFGILVKLGMLLLTRSWNEIIVSYRQQKNSRKMHSWMFMLYLSSVGDVRLTFHESQILNLKILCWTTAGDEPLIQVRRKRGALRYWEESREKDRRDGEIRGTGKMRQGENANGANGTAESVRARACVAAVMLDADMKYSTLNPTNCHDFLLPATLRWHKQALSLDWPRCLETDKFSEMAWLFIQGQDPSCLQLALSSQQWLLIERRMRKITLLPHNGCHSSLKSTEATEAVPLANSIMGIIYPSVVITFRLSASVQ